MKNRKSFVLFNPYDPDALEFIRAIRFSTGMRPICLYTDTKDRFYIESNHADLQLKDHEVEERIEVDEKHLASVAKRLASQYEIVGVIPFREYYVELCADLLDHLDVDWMSGEDLRLFRDKHRMKVEIAKRDPSVRVPASRIVRTVADVFAESLPDQYVIKPNDGAGSSHLGFFAGEDRASVTLHLAKEPGETWILEERILGAEFRINGVVRRDGTVHVLWISEYVPLQLSETFTLSYSAESQLRTNDPRWKALVGYTEKLLTAAGLWGSPFHLEVKVDDDGPAVVDLGARVASDGSGWAMSLLHPDKPDLYAVAARDYLGDNDFALGPPSYSSYDSACIASICGVSGETGWLTEIRGLDEVEAHPAFLRWLALPDVGTHIEETNDLRTCPYIAFFRHDGGLEETIALRDWVYDTIELRVRPDAPPWSKVRIRNTAKRATTRAQWMASPQS